MTKILMLFLFMFSFALCGCASQNEAQIISPAVEVVGIYEEKTNQIGGVAGRFIKIKNNSNEKITNLSITATLLDESGKEIGQTLAKGDGTWIFPDAEGRVLMDSNLRIKEEKALSVAIGYKEKWKYVADVRFDTIDISTERKNYHINFPESKKRIWADFVKPIKERMKVVEQQSNNVMMENVRTSSKNAEINDSKDDVLRKLGRPDQQEKRIFGDNTIRETWVYSYGGSRQTRVDFRNGIVDSIGEY